MTILNSYDLAESTENLSEITCNVDEIGVITYTLNNDGVLHRDDDLPAVIYPNGDMCWYKFGKRHREDDLPAIIYANGLQAWYKNGELYRDGDNPTLIFSESVTEERVDHSDENWYTSGKSLRDFDVPSLIYKNADKFSLCKRHSF